MFHREYDLRTTVAVTVSSAQTNYQAASLHVLYPKNTQNLLTESIIQKILRVVTYRAQQKNANEDRDDFGQIDTEEIDRVEQSICKTDYRCCDADEKLTGNTSSETNCDTTTNTENDPKIFERNLKQNKELLAGVIDKFRGKRI